MHALMAELQCTKNMVLKKNCTCLIRFIREKRNFPYSTCIMYNGKEMMMNLGFYPFNTCMGSL